MTVQVTAVSRSFRKEMRRGECSGHSSVTRSHPEPEPLWKALAMLVTLRLFSMPSKGRRKTREIQIFTDNR